MPDFIDYTPDDWLDTLSGVLVKSKIETCEAACHMVATFYGPNADTIGDALITEQGLMTLSHTGLPAPNSVNFWVGKRYGDMLKTAEHQLAVLTILKNAKDNEKPTVRQMLTNK